MSVVVLVDGVVVESIVGFQLNLPMTAIMKYIIVMASMAMEASLIPWLTVVNHKTMLITSLANHKVKVVL